MEEHMCMGRWESRPLYCTDGSGPGVGLGVTRLGVTQTPNHPKQVSICSNRKVDMFARPKPPWSQGTSRPAAQCYMVWRRTSWHKTSIRRQRRRGSDETGSPKETWRQWLRRCTSSGSGASHGGPPRWVRLETRARSDRTRHSCEIMIYECTTNLKWSTDSL